MGRATIDLVFAKLHGTSAGGTLLRFTRRRFHEWIAGHEARRRKPLTTRSCRDGIIRAFREAELSILDRRFAVYSTSTENRSWLGNRSFLEKFEEIFRVVKNHAPNEQSHRLRDSIRAAIHS